MTSLALNVKQAADGMQEVALRRLLDAARKDLQRGRKMICNSGALNIKAGASPTVDTSNAVNGVIEGVFFTKAAGDMAALSGTVTDGNTNVFVFTVKADGTLATHMGVEGATLGAVVGPDIPEDEAVIGYITAAASGADFVGGTTALDAGTVTVAYVNTPFPFNLKDADSLEA